MAWGTGLSAVLPPEAGPPMGKSQDFCAPSYAWDVCSATDGIPAQGGLPLEVGCGGPWWPKLALAQPHYLLPGDKGVASPQFRLAKLCLGLPCTVDPK